MNSNGKERPIGFRRIRLSSGPLNLSNDIPQNSFRSIAGKFVGGADRLFDITAVMAQSGKAVQDGVFILVAPSVDGEAVKTLSHACIAVKSGFDVFDCLLAHQIHIDARCDCFIALASVEDGFEPVKQCKSAADHNLSDVRFAYADFLSVGCGVSVDLAEAARYYKLAADHFL
jgi:TPR repeat protein